MYLRYDVKFEILNKKIRKIYEDLLSWDVFFIRKGLKRNTVKKSM